MADPFTREHALSMLEKARERVAEERERLLSLPVELQVKDSAHARSPEVLEFCLKHLTGGGTWAELRAKLGIRNPQSDVRWRIIREMALQGLMPTNEEEALKATASRRLYLLDKLEGMLEEIDARLMVHGTDKVDKMVEPQFYKMRLDAIKLLLDENNHEFSSHIELKRAKQADKKTQGPSIIVQNKFYIPRPGDDLEKMRDVVEATNKLVQAKQILDDAEED